MRDRSVVCVACAGSCDGSVVANTTDRSVLVSTVGGNSTEVKRDGGCVAFSTA